MLLTEGEVYHVVQIAHEMEEAWLYSCTTLGGLARRGRVFPSCLPCPWFGFDAIKLCSHWDFESVLGLWNMK